MFNHKKSRNIELSCSGDVDHNCVVLFLRKPLDCGYTLDAILRVHTIHVSSKYKEKMSTHVPPVLVYSLKFHVHNFIRRFLALIYMFSKQDSCLSSH